MGFGKKEGWPEWKRFLLKEMDETTATGAKAWPRSLGDAAIKSGMNFPL